MQGGRGERAYARRRQQRCMAENRPQRCFDFYLRTVSAVIAALCVAMSGCYGEKKNVKHFGMDINILNPLYMTALDTSSGNKVFSRDPSVISAVTTLFENMEGTPDDKKTDKKGIIFTATTMCGDFSFGECTGDRLRIDGREYTLKKDYSKDLRLIFERLVSETEHTTDVPRERIMAVTPDMTYAELLSSFGQTLETAVTEKGKAWLYKYRDRPFYIRKE